MKPKSAKAETKKLPPSKRPAVLYRYQHEDCDVLTDLAPPKDDNFAARTCSIALVLPMPTLKSAKARLKIEQMTQEELVEGVGKDLFAKSDLGQTQCEYLARSILSFLGLNPPSHSQDS